MKLFCISFKYVLRLVCISLPYVYTLTVCISPNDYVSYECSICMLPQCGCHLHVCMSPLCTVNVPVLSVCMSLPCTLCLCLLRVYISSLGECPPPHPLYVLSVSMSSPWGVYVSFAGTSPPYDSESVVNRPTRRTEHLGQSVMLINSRQSDLLY